MSTDKLIRMANQIASFFRSYPDDQAVTGIRDHLVAFWTPSMRSALPSTAAQNNHELDPLVMNALLMHQAGKSTIARGVHGPEGS